LDDEPLPEDYVEDEQNQYEDMEDEEDSPEVCNCVQNLIFCVSLTRISKVRSSAPEVYTQIFRAIME